MAGAHSGSSFIASISPMESATSCGHRPLGAHAAGSVVATKVVPFVTLPRVYLLETSSSEAILETGRGREEGFRAPELHTVLTAPSGRCAAVRSKNMEAVVRSTIVASGSRPSPETPFGTRGLTSSRAFVTQHPLAAGSRAARCSSAPPTSDQRRVGGLCDQSVCFLTRRRGARRGASARPGHSSVVQMSTSPRVIQPPVGAA